MTDLTTLQVVCLCDLPGFWVLTSVFGGLKELTLFSDGLGSLLEIDFISV